MGQRVIAENAGVVSVTYKLPNKHYIPVNMNYIGVDNTTPLSIIRFFPFFVIWTKAVLFLLPEVMISIVSCDRENQSLNLLVDSPSSTMIEGGLLLSVEIISRDSRRMCF